MVPRSDILPGADTMQVTLFADGRIQFACNGITTFRPTHRPKRLWVSPPGGSPPLLQIDYLTNPSFTTNGPTTVLEQFKRYESIQSGSRFCHFYPGRQRGLRCADDSPSSIATAATGTVQDAAIAPNGSPIAGAKVRVTCFRNLRYAGLTTTDPRGTTLARVFRSAV